MTTNALLTAGLDVQARYDLVGPTVEDDIRRAISRYGVAAVKEAVKRGAKVKRGRKAVKDWPELQPTLIEDARKLLEGGDPFTDRTNYAIAQEYVARNAGHSQAATHRRIMKKLSERRVMWTLIHAERLGENDYPYSAYLNVLERLINILPDWDNWPSSLRRVKLAIDDYTAKHGPPEDHLSIAEIERAAREPVSSAWAGLAPPPLGGLFGLGGIKPKQ